eukprot:TRINITY_DN983_c0_g2_i1.p1 TRINITY_DN983_c0_g2~~TRINITY_DN983_c0_g2_i1.p1  ORF type:complete len:256 (+),score=36.32 TRINITY_DN983_c0_g2_i1:782-1549(+)
MNKEDDISQTYPGPYAFSENATLKLSEYLKLSKPHFFISIHSGTELLAMPFAYKKARADRNQKDMESILKYVDKKYCQGCYGGAVSESLPYLAYGSSVDYVYQILEANYSVVFETYKMRRPMYWRASQQQNTNNNNFLQTNEQDRKARGEQATLNMNEEHTETTYAVETDSGETMLLYPDQCFRFFNPDNRATYDEYVNRFVGACYESYINAKNAWQNNQLSLKQNDTTVNKNPSLQYLSRVLYCLINDDCLQFS